MTKNTLPEILAPAGSFECLVAAVEAGADAVYVGGKRFGARAFAKNFDIDELARAAVYCNLHGVKLYVTVNTLIDDKEFPELIEYAAELYRIGVSALIIADLGAIAEIKRCVPDLELHASTQMSVHNTAGAVAARNLGVSRVVVARELPLTEIKSIVRESGCEIEMFLHGALCVCYSGQCLFSSLVGGRSGNRGECAQPCRLPYNGGKYPISLKDLSLADHIPALIESGVASLKIEGRMKSAEYVYTVTKIYRTLLDEKRCANAEEKEALRRAFSRGGFTDAYLKGTPQLPMTGIRSESDKEDSRATEERKFEPMRKKVTAKVDIRLGQPAKMTITDGTRTVTAEGAIPAPAENAPLDPESTKARLSKMGNTYLAIDASDIELTLDEGVNLAPSALNALRRDAAEKFESVRRTLPEFEYSPQRYAHTPRRPITTAKFFSESAYRDAAKRENLAKLIDIPFVPIFSGEDVLSAEVGVYLPPIIFDGETEEIKNNLEKAKNSGVMYALVGNLGQIELVKSYGLTPVGDFRLNATNSHTAEVYHSLGIEHLVLSPELTLPKARDVGGSVITYGRIPLMITERCFMKENFGCKNCGNAALTDRKGEKFPMLREFPHRNIILNSVPTYLGDRTKELSQYKIASKHLLFTVERGDEIVRILKAHKAGLPLADGKVRRAGRR